MPSVREALVSFEQKASAARARYWKALREGTSPKEARRVHDQARQQGFIDLLAALRKRQAELAGYLDESRWTSDADAQAAPGYREELEDAHTITRSFGARIRLGRLWDLGAERQQPSAQRPAASRPAEGSVDAAAGGQQLRPERGFDMNDLIRRGG
jgi:hypothetical protein